MADATPTDYTYTPPPSTTTTNTPSPGSPNISLREYIYPLPHPLPPGTPTPYTPGLPDKNPLNLPPHPFEPTSTLVLTTPTNTFVDIRYLKPQHPHESPLPNCGETERLEWAFAGESSSTASSTPDHALYGAVRHSTWTHWVDSRVAVGEAPAVDEGDMYSISETRTVEYGYSFQERLGEVGGYEEGWVDVAVRSTGEGDGGEVSVLLRHEDTNSRSRGVVVRVGQFCQGVFVSDANVSTERWEFGFGDGAEAAAAQGSSWRRAARTGDAFLPCAAAFRPKEMRVGGTVRYQGVEWVVEGVWGV